MYAMLSEQGTACDETAICGICFAGRQGEVAKVEQLVSRSTGPDRPRPGWHRCDLNDVLQCVLCGRTSALETVTAILESPTPARAACAPCRPRPVRVSPIAIAMAVEASKTISDSAASVQFAGKLARMIFNAGLGSFSLDFCLRLLQEGVKRGLLVREGGNFRPAPAPAPSSTIYKPGDKVTVRGVIGDKWGTLDAVVKDIEPNGRILCAKEGNGHADPANWVSAGPESVTPREAHPRFPQEQMLNPASAGVSYLTDRIRVEVGGEIAYLAAFPCTPETVAAIKEKVRTALGRLDPPVNLEAAMAELFPETVPGEAGLPHLDGGGTWSKT